uniref:Luc7-like protein 3 n=1 Tax=Ascaris suum TaxID=6253 RepID=F1L423_ASCSU
MMAAMLNELMGPKRNADFGDTNEPDFDEPDVCKHFLVAFCPNEMFRNTKADLGYCSKIHDPALRTKYRQSSRFEKLGYEEDFLNKIRRLDDEVRRKIEKNERRLAVTQPLASVATTSEDGEVESDAQRRQKELVAEQQSSLSAKISECMDKAEKLGAQGKVDEAKEAVRQAEKFKQERTALERLLTQSSTPANHIEDLANQLSKPMEVCQVCGCFMLVNDVQQRIDDHYAGKQHMAYAKIRATIEEMDKKREEKRKKALIEGKCAARLKEHLNAKRTFSLNTASGFLFFSFCFQMSVDRRIQKFTSLLMSLSPSVSSSFLMFPIKTAHTTNFLLLG